MLVESYLHFLFKFKRFVIFLKNLKKFKDHDLKTTLPNRDMSWGHQNSRFLADKLEARLCAIDKNITIRNHPDFTSVIEIIRDRYYFATLITGKKNPRGAPNLYLFDIDDEFIYNNFYNDFGPLNLACLYKYCRGVNQILQNPKHDFETIVHFTSNHPEKRANAAYLAASYAVLYLDITPDEAYNIVTQKGKNILKPFQDASLSCTPPTITLIDCLNGLCKAASLGFFNFEDFDVKEYEKYEQLKYGDLNWIVPRKFLAFLGPNTDSSTGSHYPEKYLNYFLKNDVVAVVRLNHKSYESFRFTNAGIMHYELFFTDGTVPPKTILKQFLHISENTKGAIAVHCKAGLGRTGTLIGAYMMKHYKMSAREVIAWLRICRPGSVIGPQQGWLEKMECTLWREGRQFRQKYYGNENLILHHKKGIYSVAANFNRKYSRLKEYFKESSETASKSKSDTLDKKKSHSSKPSPRAHSAVERTQKSSAHQQSQTEDTKRTKTQGDKLNDIKTRRAKTSTAVHASERKPHPHHHHHHHHVSQK